MLPDGKWIDILPVITKQYNNRVHSSTKLTPIHASSKKNEGYVYKNLIDERKKIKTKFQINDLVRTADLKKTFSIEIKLIGLISYIKLQKNLMILLRAIVLTIYQNVIRKRY